jgi:hypothetical protein
MTGEAYDYQRKEQHNKDHRKDKLSVRSCFDPTHGAHYRTQEKELDATTGDQAEKC